MVRARGKQANNGQQPAANGQTDHAMGDLEHSLVEHLARALNDGSSQDNGMSVIDDSMIQPDLQSHGDGSSGHQDMAVDDQLLLESLNQIIGSSGLADQHLQQQNQHHHGYGQGEESMQDALSLARLLIQHNGGNADMAGQQHHLGLGDSGMGLNDLALPSSLDGPTDAATLKAVQNILQELGSAWDEPGSRPKGTRSRQRGEPLTAADRERIRMRDRMRKQKWRDINSTRNKDHDLRARISKRAIDIFGAEDSAEKQQWIEKEFASRREKRNARDSTHSRRPRAAALASELRDLFAKSNAVMQGPWRQFTEGLIPRHLVRAFMIPSPPRPALEGKYKPKPVCTRPEPHIKRTASSVSMGFPPNLLKLVSREKVDIKLEP